MLFVKSRLILSFALLVSLPPLSAEGVRSCWAEDGGEDAAELLTPKELQARLKDPLWRILDARQSADYRRGHIPGAVRVDARQWIQHAQEPTGLSDRAYWSDAVGSLGIDRTTGVVVYADNIATSARVWWLLGYLGIPRLALLDGGWEAWEFAQLPVQKEAPQVVAADFRAGSEAGWLTETEQLRRTCESDELQIIDARSQAEYTGERGLGGAPGRIPHAIHLDWLEFLDDQWCFREFDELQRLLKAKGISPSKRQVVYCHSGARSSVVLFALRRLGYSGASNYFGGWQQWRTAAESPIEAGFGS